MTYVLAYPVAIAASLSTTICVLGLWIAHARVVDGDRADSVFLPFVFLFVPLVFFVAVASNLVAVALGQIVSTAAPSVAFELTIASAGVLVWCACAWTQRGRIGAGGASAPISIGPVALFSAADMLNLAGGLYLLPHSMTS